MAGGSFSTPSQKGPALAGVPKPPAKPAAKAAPKAPPVQVKAHSRAAPTSKPKANASKPVSPLLNPNQTLSGQNLLSAAQQLANVQTQGPLAELQKQIAANNAQTQGTVKLTGGFYNQLEPFVQSGVNQQGQIGSALNSQLAGIGQGAQSQLQGIGQGAMASLAQYAPGAAASAASGDLAAQVARQQGLAAQQSATSQAFGATQGANYQGMGASQLGTFGLQGQEALKGIAQSGTVKNQPLAQKIADLRAQQGSLVATDLGKLRQQEINNNIAKAGLHLKGQEATTTAQNDQARNKLAKQKLKQSGKALTLRGQQQAFNNNPLKVGSPAWERSQKETGTAFASDPNAVGSEAWARVQAANARSATKAGGGGGKPLTANENNVANTRLNNIMSAIQQWQKDGIKGALNAKQAQQQGLKPGQIGVIEPHPTDAQMRQVLGTQYANPLVEAAFDLLGWGYLTRPTAQALHQMGIRGTTFRGKPVAVKARPVGPAPVSAGNAQVPGF